MSAHRRLLHFSYELTVFIVLLGLLIPSLESTTSVVNGIMGQSATLPSGLPEELNLKSLRWRRNGTTVAQKNQVPSGEFKDRALLNPSDWSLTIKQLRGEDSGDYTCLAFPENGSQLPSHSVTLRVYEMITSVAIKTNVSKTSSNETCALTLLCTAEQHKHTSFSWKRGGLDVTGDSQTALGSTLEVPVSFEDQNLTYTCKAANPVSQKTATVIPWKKCFNKKEEKDGAPKDFDMWMLLYVGLPLVIAVTLLAVAGVCYIKKPNKSPAQTPEPELATVYAQIQTKNTRRGQVEAPDSIGQQSTSYSTIYEFVKPVETPESQPCFTLYDSIRHDRI